MPRMTGNRYFADAVRAEADVLAQAERPVIIAGGGGVWSGAEAELVKLAELLQIPVATSLNAKVALLDDHPLNVGVPGTSLAIMGTRNGL